MVRRDGNIDGDLRESREPNVSAHIPGRNDTAL